MAARATPLSSFKNADEADNIGAEVELRKNLEFLSGRPRSTSKVHQYRHRRTKKILSDLSFGANFAYIYSQVKLRPPPDCSALPTAEQAGCEAEALLDVSTSRSRSLADQSPWVVNAHFSYDNDDIGTSVRLLYNTFGRRIAFVGAQGLPDIFQEPIHGLDFVFSQRLHKGLSLSFSARNLLDWPNRRTQGDDRIITYEARDGIAFGLGVGYSF